jgi:hypothetical protein
MSNQKNKFSVDDLMEPENVPQTFEQIEEYYSQHNWADQILTNMLQE